MCLYRNALDMYKRVTGLMLIGGNEARVSMVMLVTQSVSEGLGIVHLCPLEEKWKKRRCIERKRVAHTSGCFTQKKVEINV